MVVVSCGGCFFFFFFFLVVVVGGFGVGVFVVWFWAIFSIAFCSTV